MTAPVVHAQRILHKLRDVEHTLKQLGHRQPTDPGVGELLIEVGLLRKAIELGLEDMVP